MFNSFNEREYLLNVINKYKYASYQVYNNYFDEQYEIINKFDDFIKLNSNCFLRTNFYGHVTGSAFVVNQNFSKVLFTYHAKLHRWLQLGGHADGEIIIQKVALKEACEESGMENFDFIDILNFPSSAATENFQEIIPFDLDIHLIPERITEPAHYHFDVRFILVAKQDKFIISNESLDLKWIDLDDVCKYSSEQSTLRQVYKFRHLQVVGNNKNNGVQNLHTPI